MLQRSKWCVRMFVIAASLFTARMAVCIAEEKDQKPAQGDPRLQSLYKEEAKRWEMWVGSDKKQQAQIIDEPVFRWQNLSRANGQSGAMFVWVFEGRPAVIGGVFSNPENKRRVIMHEFHALGSDRLFPEFRDSKSKWLPGAGVSLKPLPEAPAVADSFAKRTRQFSALARDFTANSTDDQKERWELRLLPKPLFRYDHPEGDVIDGALFAFVSDAGTDPEVVLVLEARREKSETEWFYRAVRLSISDLRVNYQGKPVWTSLRDDPEGAFGNKDNTYGLVRDRVIDELPPQDK